MHCLLLSHGSVLSAWVVCGSFWWSRQHIIFLRVSSRKTKSHLYNNTYLTTYNRWFPLSIEHSLHIQRLALLPPLPHTYFLFAFFLLNVFILNETCIATSICSAIPVACEEMDV
jgi:hypothetical protein